MQQQGKQSNVNETGGCKLHGHGLNPHQGQSATKDFSRQITCKYIYPSHEPRCWLGPEGATKAVRETSQEEIAPTWEAIVIDVAEGGHALPEVCVVGAVTAQDELLFQHSLASRK